jgi:hypothetical protein
MERERVAVELRHALEMTACDDLSRVLGKGFRLLPDAFQRPFGTGQADPRVVALEREQEWNESEAREEATRRA